MSGPMFDAGKFIDYVWNLREERDTLRAANQRLEGELERLGIEYVQALHGVTDMLAETERLEGEVARFASEISNKIRHWKPKSRLEMDAKNAVAEMIIAALAGAGGDL